VFYATPVGEQRGGAISSSPLLSDRIKAALDATDVTVSDEIMKDAGLLE